MQSCMPPNQRMESDRANRGANRRSRVHKKRLLARAQGATGAAAYAARWALRSRIQEFTITVPIDACGTATLTSHTVLLTAELSRLCDKFERRVPIS
jgi:hypothetical protein